jgi:hypothetical protein
VNASAGNSYNSLTDKSAEGATAALPSAMDRQWTNCDFPDIVNPDPHSRLNRPQAQLDAQHECIAVNLHDRGCAAKAMCHDADACIRPGGCSPGSTCPNSGNLATWLHPRAAISDLALSLHVRLDRPNAADRFSHLDSSRCHYQSSVCAPDAFEVVPDCHMPAICVTRLIANDI